MEITCKGAFSVTITPADADKSAGEATVARMVLVKQFFGDLAGTSDGQMLAMTTSVEGSAGYVAMERVTGTLLGRSGTFALQHTGTMARGMATLLVTIVPDSATGQLAGLAGSLAIDVVNGEHYYELRATLPDGA